MVLVCFYGDQNYPGVYSKEMINVIMCNESSHGLPIVLRVIAYS
jgi:hypothetical protein